MNNEKQRKKQLKKENRSKNGDKIYMPPTFSFYIHRSRKLLFLFHSCLHTASPTDREAQAEKNLLVVFCRV